MIANRYSCFYIIIIIIVIMLQLNLESVPFCLLVDLLR